MSEKAPQYHPEIEKVMVTSGEDIGRVKDKDFAHEVANKIQDEMDQPYSPDFPVANPFETNTQDKILKQEVAKRAIKNDMGLIEYELTSYGELSRSRIIDATDKATRVRGSYDELSAAASKQAESKAESDPNTTNDAGWVKVNPLDDNPRTKTWDEQSGRWR